ncbi:MAG: spore maturation protein [Firmicutes bacterium]|nr:spore maturation protein [Bacillota bacterium]
MALITVLSSWLIPLFVASVLLAGGIKRVAVFDEFIEGSKEGLHTTLRLLPYLVSMLVAIEILSASGALDALTGVLAPFLAWLKWPAETFPLALLRPMSNSGAMAITADILNRFGPDSYIGMVASTMQGSTDTTLFIITVYYGAVGIKKIRHSLWAGLIADAAAMLASLIFCRLLMG